MTTDLCLWNGQKGNETTRTRQSVWMVSPHCTYQEGKNFLLVTIMDRS